MIIYKDLVSGDEMFSDTYKMKLVDDCVYEVEGKMVTETTTVDESKLGANASAEGLDDEGADASSQTGCNIVLANRLVETQFTLKDFKTYIKAYMKALKKRLEEDHPDKVADFEKGANTFVTKKVFPNFKNWQFFLGEKMDPDGMCALMDFREDGTTPYMVFFKHGLLEEKV